MVKSPNHCPNWIFSMFSQLVMAKNDYKMISVNTTYKYYCIWLNIVTNFDIGPLPKIMLAEERGDEGGR